MSEYDELAERAERGELASKPGTARRGADAAAAGQRALMVRALAAQRHVPMSQVVRDAVAAYVDAR